mmetsp:Transcript_10577/g.13254  ORF Transcript_10577/g.13254 Transcript_10577/m.13254 type:complete len:296 (-) Transcript_10577:1568-2455(-)
MIKKEKYGPGVDWFQLGVFTYECLYGHLPFEPKRKIEDAETPFSPTRQDEMNALKCKLKLPEYEDDRTISFIKGLLELDCKKRLGADEFIKTSPLEDFNTAAAKIPVINGSATEPANVNVETHAEDKEGEEVDVVFIDDYEFPRVGMSLRNHPFFWALEGATATHVDWEKVATQQYNPVYIPVVPELKTIAKYRNFAQLKQDFKRQAKVRKDTKQNNDVLDTRREGNAVDVKLQQYFDNWDFVHIHEIKLEKMAEKLRREKNPNNHKPFFNDKFRRFRYRLTGSLTGSRSSLNAD